MPQKRRGPGSWWVKPAKTNSEKVVDDWEGRRKKVSKESKVQT